MSDVRTNPVTGQPAKVWLLEDRLDALREFGSPQSMKLPSAENAAIAIGRDPPVSPVSPDGGVQTLRFPHHDTLSRKHATMQRVTPSCWMIFDTDSKNGISVDGLPSQSAHVLPGQLIQLGDLQLLAMSERVRAIQYLWTRYITIRQDRESLLSIDAALWASHWLAMPEQRVLLLRGRINDALPWRMHRAWRGPDRPFVSAEPGENQLTVEELRRLVEQAKHGTLFLREPRLGKEACSYLYELVTSRRRVAVGFIIAGPRSSDLRKARSVFGGTKIVDVPDFTQRVEELPTLIVDAIETRAPVLGVPVDLLLALYEDERVRIAARTWEHYDDLEQEVWTSLAVRFLGRKAAKTLGRSYSAVSKFRRAMRMATNESSD